MASYSPTSKPGKSPKIRFRPGMKFQYQGTIWELVYMYRLTGQEHQGVWYHCLEEQKPVSESTARIRGLIVEAGQEYNGSVIIFEPFRSYRDAQMHFRNRMMMGGQSIKTTQELIKLPRAEQ